MIQNQSLRNAVAGALFGLSLCSASIAGHFFIQYPDGRRDPALRKEQLAELRCESYGLKIRSLQADQKMLQDDAFRIEEWLSGLNAAHFDGRLPKEYVKLVQYKGNQKQIDELLKVYRSCVFDLYLTNPSGDLHVTRRSIHN